MSKEYVDALDKLYGPGDVVVYPVQSGHRLNLQFARVAGHTPGGYIRVQKLDWLGKPVTVTLRRTDLIIKVEANVDLGF